MQRYCRVHQATGYSIFWFCSKHPMFILSFQLHFAFTFILLLFLFSCSMNKHFTKQSNSNKYTWKTACVRFLLQHDNDQKHTVSHFVLDSLATRRTWSSPITWSWSIICYQHYQIRLSLDKEAQVSETASINRTVLLYYVYENQPTTVWRTILNTTLFMGGCSHFYRKEIS